MTFFEKIVGSLDEKREYKEMQKRAKQLPEEYYEVYKAIQKYMFTTGMADWRVFYEIIELLELAELDGRSIKDVVGDDVAAFCDELTADKRSDWKEKYRQQLNNHFKNR
ncbi:DUF1048 domain-containing protein [Aeromicrobium ponti]|uniref:DNA-binding ferritin-like protein (Dps family) n=1 Tax=Cytobacillus oceanisediminis TaxID=665099 RepID=A0A562J3M9_9BACI|nr:DUF1048 domain-containing protein [Cytobacillus oceanisediminis]TWH77851.1 DNA-binding ferritin-like protein (Dps family) [Cytobacillus oceanisediminis]